MGISRRWATAGTAAALLAAVVGGTALAQSGHSSASSEAVETAEDNAEGPDVPITGDALEQAEAAALEHLGEGTVTATEVGDEESYYEVEVTLPDGRQVDVQLDEDFRVVGDDPDGRGD